MKEEERLKKEKQDMLGFYDYTVVLTYISLVISVFGMTRALAGDFKVAILCLALSGLCDMFDGKIARGRKRPVQRMRRNSEFRSTPCAMWYVLAYFRH